MTPLTYHEISGPGPQHRATLLSAVTPLSRVSTLSWLVRLFRTTVLVLNGPSCVAPPTSMAAMHPGVENRPSSTTVLSAIRLLWILAKLIPEQALVMTTLFVTV